MILNSFDSNSLARKLSQCKISRQSVAPFLRKRRTNQQSHFQNYTGCLLNFNYFKNRFVLKIKIDKHFRQ